MKIRMKTTMAGPDGSWGPGAVRELTPVEGMILIDGGYAELLDVSVADAVEETPDTPKPSRRKKAASSEAPAEGAEAGSGEAPA